MLFLGLLLPIMVSGQDSTKIRKILEKSIQVMDLHCKTLEYRIKWHGFWQEPDFVSNVYSKVVFDSDHNPLKLFIDEKEYTNGNMTGEPEEDRIFFADKILDTAYFYLGLFNVLKVSDYQNQIKKNPVSIFRGYNYFTESTKSMKYMLEAPTPLPDNKDTVIITENSMTVYLGDPNLSFKGISRVNGKPHYVIEERKKYYANVSYRNYRYPDNKPVVYIPALDYRLFYIDTSSYVQTRLVQFVVTTENDTTQYSDFELLNYKIDSFTDIVFNTKDYKINKILDVNPAKLEIKELDTCFKTNVLKDLQGKAPNINGKDTANSIFLLYKQKAKCYVLDFSHSTCGACFAYALPFWHAMQTKYNNPHIQYLLIDPVDKDMEKIKKMIQTQKINMRVIQDLNAHKNYAVTVFPSCYILDENFNILFSGNGTSTPCEKKEIEKILASYQAKK